MRAGALSAWSTRLLGSKFQIKREKWTQRDKLSPGNAVPVLDTRKSPDPIMAAEPLDHRAAEKPDPVWDSSAEEYI